MSGCTAPIEGHRTASGAANCPVCRYRSRSRPRAYYTPTVFPSTTAPYPTSAGERGSRGTSIRSAEGRSYTAAERRTLDPVRREVVRQAQVHPERRDLFLCHAWDDRAGAAKALHELLTSQGVSMWFSEKDVGLGKSLNREIDKGLRMCRAGIVLVTPALFKSLDAEGTADKELSALLATDRVIPVAHGTTFEELRDHSPLLAARSGLSTGESSLEDVAAKIAETVILEKHTT